MLIKQILASVLFAATGISDAAKSEVHFESPRLKHRIGLFSVSGEACAKRCLKTMLESVRSVVATSSEYIFVDENLIETCTLYKVAKACNAACPPSFRKTVFHQAFAATEYQCVERFDELVTQFPCFQAVTAACGEKCKMDRSKGLEMRLLTGAIDSLSSFDLDTLTLMDLFGQKCGIMDCATKCQEPIIRRLCPEAVPILTDIIRQTTLLSQRALENAGLGRIWPAECRAITANEARSSHFLREYSHQSDIKVEKPRSTKSAGKGLSTSLLLILLAFASLMFSL